MKTASVTHLKNTLSARLKEVMAGESVLITDRRKPIAVLHPLEAGETEGQLDALFQKGILRPAAKRLGVAAFLKSPRGRCAVSLSTAVVEERDGR